MTAAAHTPTTSVDTARSTARALARLLDDAIAIPGTSIRFGLDPLIGLVPGVGDLMGTILSSYVLLVALRVGAPPVVLLRMAGNIAIDGVLGAVPIAGDLFDVGWKANRRNVQLLERWLDHPRRVVASSRASVALVALFVAVAIAGSVAIAAAVIGGIVRLLG